MHKRKSYILPLLLVLILNTVGAQNIKLINSGEIIVGGLGSEMRSEIQIQNTSDEPIMVMVRRIDMQIGSSQRSYFCWGNDCQDSMNENSTMAKRILPGEITSDFVSVLESGLVEGESMVKYLIYEKDDLSNFVEYEANYKVGIADPHGMLFNSENTKLSDIYPNPVREVAILDYTINNEETKAKIIIHNILGSIIGEYDLATEESQLKISTLDFNAGVYFYTLYIDEDGIITKKLVIKK